METLHRFQAALNGRAWVTVDEILKSLPTSLPTSRNLRDIQIYLNTTRAIIDHLNECVDPTISFSKVNPIVYGLVLHDSASLPEYLTALLENGEDLTFIIDRLVTLLIRLCFSLDASDVRSRLGECGLVQALSQYYCQNPYSVPVVKALTALACGHIENADHELICGVVSSAIKALSLTDLSKTTAKLVESLLRLLATVAICAPNDPSVERGTLVSTVLNVLQEATRLSLPVVAEHALTVLANASDCVLRDGDGYDFPNIRKVAEEVLKAWASFKASPNLSHRAAWALVSLVHIDQTARAYVSDYSDKILTLFNGDLLTYDTHSFLRDVISPQKVGRFPQKRAKGRLRKPWSTQEACTPTELTTPIDIIDEAPSQLAKGITSNEPVPVSEPARAAPFLPIQTRHRAASTSTFTTNTLEHIEPISVRSQLGTPDASGKQLNVPDLGAREIQSPLPVISERSLNRSTSLGLRRSERSREKCNPSASWKGLCETVTAPKQYIQRVSNIGDRTATGPGRSTRTDVQRKRGHPVSTRESLIRKPVPKKKTVVLLKDISNGLNILRDSDPETEEDSEECEGNESRDGSEWDQASNMSEDASGSEIFDQLSHDDDTRDALDLMETDDDEESCSGGVSSHDGGIARRPTGGSPSRELLLHMQAPTEVPLSLSGVEQRRNQNQPGHHHLNAGGSKRRVSTRLNGGKCGQQRAEFSEVRPLADRSGLVPAAASTTRSRSPRPGKFARSVKRPKARRTTEVIIVDDN